MVAWKMWPTPSLSGKLRRDAQLDELVAHGDELIPRGGNLNVVLLEDVDVVEDRHIVAGVRHGIVLAVVGRRHGQVALVDLIEEGLIRKLLIVAVLDLLLELHLGRPVGENRRAVVRRDAGGEHLRRVRHRVLGDLDVRIFLLEVGDDGLVAGLDRFLALLLEELELDDAAARVAVAAGVRGVGRSRFRGVARSGGGGCAGITAGGEPRPEGRSEALPGFSFS